MAGVVRGNRFKKLEDLLAEARSDAAILRASQLRLLQTLSERDQAVHDRDLSENELIKSRDHLRIMLAAVIVRGGPFEISNAEQDEAYKLADQVQIVPDEEAQVVRFCLNETVALRELPKKPLAAVPPPTDTSDTPGAEGTAGTTAEDHAPDAAEATAPSTEPLPS